MAQPDIAGAGGAAAICCGSVSAATTKVPATKSCSAWRLLVNAAIT
jgi:hypothetical protein